ncbi:MAG: CPBP family glutamic-type intramembrane protease [Chloroflexota bacterium]
MNHRKQLTVLLVLLLIYALSVFVTYIFFLDAVAATIGVTMTDTGIPPALLGLANAGITVVGYGLLGLAGYWFAVKLGLPGIFREDGNWRGWFFLPLVWGLICGVGVVIGDILFAPINDFGRMIDLGFPVSILLSINAGIGEEIIFRGFVFGLWAFILNWLFKRFNGRTAALWIANVIAALLFAASHFGTVFIMTDTTSLAELSPVLVAEIFLLNGVVGLVAGQRTMKDGLVAAVGLHFWADMVFHVAWGLSS